MKSNSFLAVLSVALLAACDPSPAEENSPPVFHAFYTKENSPLPDNQVQSLVIDLTEGIWIGTASGLTHLQGETWATYTSENSPLPSSYITKLTVDKNNTLWIGTTAGLASLNGSTWSVYTKDNSLLTHNLITALASDPLSGATWAGTEQGIVKFDETRQQRFDALNADLWEDHIRSLAVDKTGKLWIGSFNHYNFRGFLASFDGTTWTNDRLDSRGLNSAFPDALVADHTNQVWMGTRGTTGGHFVQIKPGEWEVYTTHNSSLPNSGILSMESYRESVWISGAHGIVIFRNKEYVPVSLPQEEVNPMIVTTLAFDRTGNAWFGTMSGGVGKLKAP